MVEKSKMIATTSFLGRGSLTLVIFALVFGPVDKGNLGSEWNARHAALAQSYDSLARHRR